ncbi:MAG: S-methyl-5'-thioadenosine phosphorylase [Cyanobacteria bacterium]|nr:S-methyl-5'-thioadenosine phosphorylase [Cyanobacteriota bacterium]MDA1021572.1 S-methyl-5'-thioadenosine phosphorylase [Cyanobacteriota bacterium]
MTRKKQADIGIFGGSGLYAFLDNVKEVTVETPYGAPSDSVFIGEHAGKKIAFLPRHQREHRIPPHKINYRANVWALKELGCSSVICPCAAGSLQTNYKPGDFAIADQWVDRTSGRKDTFFDGPITTHVSPAEPYTPELRKLAVEAARENNITVHDGGTIVVINGPRFSSKAESEWFHKMGWQIINMTQYPEAHLVREAGMACVNISLITDYDSGVHTGTEPVSHGAVMEVFGQNIDKLRKMLFSLIEKIPVDEFYGADKVLENSRF